jgi:hypothetical protein
MAQRRGEKDRCGRRGFPHDPRPPRRRRVQGRSPSGCKPKFISASLCLLVGAALAATFASSRTWGSEFIGAGFTATPASSRAESSGRKPLLQKPSFCRSGFSRDPCVIENLGFGVYRSGFHCDPCVIEGGGSGRKPLLQKPSFRRSGFSRDPCVIENQGFRVTEAAFTATPASSKAEVRGESPSYRNRLFVGAALAATLASSRTRGSEFIGASSVATPAPSKTRVRGGRSRLFLSEDRRWGGGQLRAVALLEPHGATRGGWSLSLSDHSRT